jgi:hypothetical protein
MYIRFLLLVSLVLISNIVNAQIFTNSEFQRYLLHQLEENFPFDDTTNNLALEKFLIFFKTGMKKTSPQTYSANFDFKLDSMTVSDLSTGDANYSNYLFINRLIITHDFTLITDTLKNLDIDYSTVGNDLVLDGCKIRQQFGGMFTHFSGDFLCSQITLDSSAEIHFMKCVFDKSVTFQFSKLDGNIRFHRYELNVFNGRVAFKDCKITGTIDLSNSKIHSYLGFPQCVMSGELTLPSMLPDTLDLSGLRYQFVHSLNLTGFSVTPGQEKLVNLFNTDLTNIKLDYKYFELYFPANITDDEIKGVYESLLEKLKKDGFEASVEKLDIEYKKYKFKKEGKWLNDFIQKEWWNYGYKKELIFRNSIIFYLFFSIIIMLFFRPLLKNVYSIENILAAYADNKKGIIGLVSKRVFLPLAYTFILFFGLKIDVGQMNFRNVLPLLFVIIVYSTGLICSAFMFAYILNK